MNRRIPLTKGQFALVDDADYDWLMQWKWCYAAVGYAVSRIQGRVVYMHRLIAGSPQGMEIDHVDHDKLNNCRSNLRIATRAQNNGNRLKQPNTTSRYKGVAWYKAQGRWRAMIHRDDRPIFLGYFDDEIEAARAYDRAARELFGDFAKTNF